MSEGHMDTQQRWAVLATFRTQARCTNWRGWEQAMEESFHGRWKDWDLRDGTWPIAIEDQILDFNPTHILILLADGLELNLGRLKCKGAKLIYFFADYWDTFENLNTTLTHHLDFMFLTNKDQIPKYQELLRIQEVHYVPMACYRHDGDFNKNPGATYDIIFVGNIYGNSGDNGIHGRRSDWWHQMKRIYGNRMSNINEPQYPARSIIYDLLPTIYSNSKYSLNMDAYKPAMRGYTSNRIWAILNFRGLCVTAEFNGMRELGLYDGENCIVFDSPAEFDEKIRFYDQRPELRDLIREKGYDLGRTKHTHQQRLEKMQEIMSR